MQCQVKKGPKTIRNPSESIESCCLLIEFWDFEIYEDCLSKKNSYAEFGDRYERPNSDICPDVKTFLAGSFKFQVSELEVYQVPKRRL